MTAYELIDVTLSVASRIEVQWGLFITVHLALFAGIIYVDRPLRLPEKAGALVLYGGFAIVNYRVLATQVGMLEGSYREALELLENPCCASNAILRHMTREISTNRLDTIDGILLLIHVATFLLVLLAVVFDRPRANRSRSPTEEVYS